MIKYYVLYICDMLNFYTDWLRGLDKEENLNNALIIKTILLGGGVEGVNGGKEGILRNTVNNKDKF